MLIKASEARLYGYLYFSNRCRNLFCLAVLALYDGWKKAKFPSQLDHILIANFSSAGCRNWSKLKISAALLCSSSRDARRGAAAVPCFTNTISLPQQPPSPQEMLTTSTCGKWWERPHWLRRVTPRAQHDLPGGKSLPAPHCCPLYWDLERTKHRIYI